MDEDFNFNRATVSPALDPSQYIDADELQCAIDCLDGDRSSEHLPVERYWVPEGPPPQVLAERIPGGVLRLVPGRLFDAVENAPFSKTTYVINRTVWLPLGSWSSVVIDGQGAHLWAGIPDDVGDQRYALLGRRATVGTNNCDVDWMSGAAMNWSIRDIEFRRHPLLGQPQLLEGISIDGSWGLTVEGCSFEDMDVGVALRYTAKPTIQRCTFRASKLHDVTVLNKHDCFDGLGANPDPGECPPAPATSPCVTPPTFCDCWDDCPTGSGMAVLVDPGYTSSGAGGSSFPELRLEGNQHHATATPTPSGSLIRLATSYGAVVDSVTADGKRPRSFLEFRGVSGSINVRNCRLAFARDPALPAPDLPPTPLIGAVDSAFVRLDAISMEPGEAAGIPNAETLLCAEFDLGPSYVAVDNMPSLPENTDFQAINALNADRWSFWNLPDTAGDVLADGRWLGGRTPAFVRADSYRLASAPWSRYQYTAPASSPLESLVGGIFCRQSPGLGSDWWVVGRDGAGAPQDRLLQEAF